MDEYSWIRVFNFPPDVSCVYILTPTKGLGLTIFSDLCAVPYLTTTQIILISLVVVERAGNSNY